MDLFCIAPNSITMRIKLLFKKTLYTMKRFIVLYSVLAFFLVCCKQEVYYSIITEARPSEGGSIVVTPSSESVLAGSVVTVKAKSKGYYYFTGWSGSLSGTNISNTIAVTSDLNIVANFSLRSYPLMIETVGEGSVTESVVSSKTDYSAGTVVELTAIPAEGWMFAMWGIGLTSRKNPDQLTITAPTTVRAIFVPKPYDLNISVQGEGSVSERIIGTKASYDDGTIVELQANPAEKWRFDHWEGDVTGTRNPVQLTMSSTKTVKAVFEKKSYDLTVDIFGEGAVSERVIETKTSYLDGAIVELTANPAEKWVFDHWEGIADTKTNPAIISIATSMRVKAYFYVADSELMRAIEFKDPEVKKIVTENFDINRDGELSYGEAASVGSLGYVFYKNPKVKSFEELRFFTGLNEIGDFAFAECQNLSSITLPETINAIDEYAFYKCSSLESINIPESVTTIGKGAFYFCESLRSIIIPNGVTRIESYTFKSCSQLESVIVPDCLESIDSLAFQNCTSLASISLPDCVTRIAREAFCWCSSLKSFCVPESLTEIDDFVFANCSELKSITIHEGVTSIGKSAFYLCNSLEAVHLPESITKIERDAFFNCSKITSVVIPNNVISIGANVFGQCTSLASVILPDNLSCLSDSCFYSCSSLRSIDIPSGVKTIGISVFARCGKMTSIVIPEAVTRIDNTAFFACEQLKSVVLPNGNGFKSIGNNAFRACISLDSIEIPAGVENLGEGVFDGCTSLKSLSLPCHISSIERSFCRDCISLSSIVIPEGVTRIGEQAFRNCSSLSSVTLPLSLSTINESAFSGCSSITSIELHNNVTDIQSYAFSGCSNLESVNIPEGLSFLRSWTFANCSRLCSITIPSSVKSIETGAFLFCTSLKTVVIPEKVTSLGLRAFGYCFGLTSIILDAVEPPQGSDMMFEETDCPIYVPSSSVEAYKTAEYWSAYASRIVPKE